MVRNRAFTLVEALVAFSIVMVLAALIMPAVQRMRTAAARATASSNLRQIGSALFQYTADQDGYLPGPLQVGQKAVYKSSQSLQLTSFLLPYLSEDQPREDTLVPVFLSPGFVRAMKGKNLQQAHPFLVARSHDVNGEKILPFGNEAKEPEKAAGPMKLAAVPGNVWVMCDADQQNPGVIGHPWANNTPPRIINGTERLSLNFDGSARGIAATDIPVSGGPPGGGPPPPPPTRPR